MAYRLEKPLTRVGILVKRCWNASLRLWAGSVEMMRTEERTEARRMERIELHVVLPTPPLPPTKTHFRESWSRTFWTVPSAWSPISLSLLSPINQSITNLIHPFIHTTLFLLLLPVFLYSSISTACEFDFRVFLTHFSRVRNESKSWSHESHKYWFLFLFDFQITFFSLFH